MDVNAFWKIIDEARAETGGKDQQAMMNCTEAKLAELPSREIVDWFNIHHLYLDLADRKDLERAAANCGIYLSDDSFLYFRGWLLSLGKDNFYAILNEPDDLSAHVMSTADARFEAFVYAGHGVYTNKAFLEEYGQDGVKQWQKDLLAENPDKGEYALEWALGNKYNLWEASAQRPLSAEQKAEIRKDLFASSAGKKIDVEKTKDTPKAVENVLLQMFPQKEEYRKLAIKLYSGYGVNMLPAGLEDFHKEMKEIFLEAGWEYHKPVFEHACPEYSKGKSRLYCHPTEISGPCEAALISEVCQQVAKATKSVVTRAEDQGRVYDITTEQYTNALKAMGSEIEQDLLKEFSLPNRGSDDDRLENVMLKYRVMTLEHHTDMLSSMRPYWKCTEAILKDLIAGHKIIKRPTQPGFSAWSYMTAPAYKMKDKSDLDSKIGSAADRAAEMKSGAQTKQKDPYERN